MKPKTETKIQFQGQLFHSRTGETALDICYGTINRSPGLAGRVSVTPVLCKRRKERFPKRHSMV